MTGHISDQSGRTDIPPTTPPPVIQPPTAAPSAASIIAFVLGILAFITCGPCTGVPALIIGLIELRNIKNRTSAAEGKPFALVGAILGGINTALIIFAILIYVSIIGLAIFGAGLSLENFD